jgi:hypothetical protein
VHVVSRHEADAPLPGLQDCLPEENRVGSAMSDPRTVGSTESRYFRPAWDASRAAYVSR